MERGLTMLSIIHHLTMEKKLRDGEFVDNLMILHRWGATKKVVVDYDAIW